MQTLKSKTAITLIFSLGLNIFLLGLLAGPFLHHGMGLNMPPPGPPNPERIVNALARELGPEDGQRVTSIYRENARGLENHHEKFRAAVLRIASAIKTQPLDTLELNKALDDIALLDQQMHHNISSVLLQVTQALSPEGRNQLAGFLERGPPHGGPRGNRGNHPSPMPPQD